MMFVLIRPCLWRKIRFGAFFQSFHPKLPTLHTYLHNNKMEKSNSVLQNVPAKKAQSSPRTSFTIAVEGNIGSGKSTLLKHFEHNDSIEVICEPIDKWTNVKGHNALGLLYEDPLRWSFSFNMYALLTRVNMHLKESPKPVKMLERSLQSTRYCFIEDGFQSNTVNKFEYSILNHWYNYLVSDEKTDLDLIVYLRADPEVCYERLKKRSRREEAGVPKVLLESLHTLHDDWLINKKFPLSAPVLVLDANSDMSTMKEIYDQTRQDILCNYS